MGSNALLYSPLHQDASATSMAVVHDYDETL